MWNALHLKIDDLILRNNYATYLIIKSIFDHLKLTGVVVKVLKEAETSGSGLLETGKAKNARRAAAIILKTMFHPILLLFVLLLTSLGLRFISLLICIFYRWTNITWGILCGL